jgi:HEAT repeat protein
MRTAVVTALGLLHDRSAVPLLQRVLRGEVRDDRARAHAATALGRIGDVAAVAPLVASLRDEPDAAVRRSVALALGAFADGTANAALLKAVEGDADLLVRGFAAVSFARGAGSAAVAPLVSLTAVRHNRSMRGFAAVALGLTGDAKSAAPVLRAILEIRSEDSLRGAAAVGLGLLGDREAGPALAALASDASAPPELRGYALLGAAMAGSADATVVARDVLTREVLTRKAPREVERAAALAAGLIPFPGSPGILVKLALQGRDPTVRGASLLGLGLSPDRGAVPLLADLAGADSGAGPMERLEAVTALGQLALGGVLPPVARIAGGMNYRELTPALEMATRLF